MTTETTAPETTSISTALTVQERAAIALASPKAEANLIALAEKSKGITVITNKAGRDECHTAAMAAKAARIAIEQAGKEAREDATAFSKAIIAEENRLVELIKPEEKRLIGIRDEWDAKIKAEKEAKEAAEKARIESIKGRIEAIRANITKAAMLDAAGANTILFLLEKEEIDDSYEEFYGDAMEARGETIAKLREIVAAKESAEAAAARIKAEQAAEAERLEAERKRLEAERAEQERIAAENRAAEEKRQAEERARLDAERAELERQRREIEEARAAQQASTEAAASEHAAPHIPCSEFTKAQDQIQPQASANDDEVLAKEVVRVEEPIESGATIKLGDISSRLGFSITADFLAGLGFQPVSTERAAKLYHEADFVAICEALINHIKAVAASEIKLAA